MSAPYFNMHLNPTAATVEAVVTAPMLNNQALSAKDRGDYATAERLHLQAIAIKEQQLGTDEVTTALSYNAIGELYLQMRRLDDAENYLDKAVRIRNTKGPALDAAVSRENLAQLYELRGNLPKAKELRLSGAPNHIVCGNYHCPGEMLNKSQLKMCGKCKSVYYCSANCQGTDWKSRHKALCHVT